MNQGLSISQNNFDPLHPSAYFPVGCGEMPELIRQFDWSQTPVGPLESWPEELRITTNIILESKFPMAILWGEELIFIYNDGYKSIINHKHPDALGKSTKDIWPEVWHFNRPIFDKVLKHGESTHLTDQLFRINRHWTSEETYFTLCYSPIRKLDQTIGGALVVLQETTRYVLAKRQLRENDQLLRNIIDSTPSHIFALDAKNHFTLVNKALADFCHSSKEKMAGKSIFEIFPQDVAQRLEQSNYQIMTKGITKYFEEEIENKSGKNKNQVMTSKFPIKDDTGTIIGIGGVATDITERKRLELELLEAKNNAEELANMKSKFLDTAAHELRTPVTIILLIVDMLQKSFDRGEIIDAKKIKQLKESTARLKSLINDLLNVSRLERGLLTLQIEPTNMSELIKKCVDDFRVLDEKRPFHFEVTGQWEEASIDQIRITQVLSNLLDNAMKYTPENSAIDISLQTHPKKIMVSVTDHGPGISDETLQHLFHAFSRGKTPLTIKANGLGLGLNVSRGIIELHGGHIGVKSKVGQGSTFYFEIPRSNS